MMDRRSRNARGLSRHRRRAAETRERLLDAALAVFIERGYEGAPLGEITRHADLGTGTLYLHFKDKRDLYEELARRELAALFETFQERARPDATATEQVSLMVRVFTEFFTANPDHSTLFLLRGPAVESFLVADVAQMIAAFLQGFVEQPDLIAHLVIGVGVAAGRCYLQRPGQLEPDVLVEHTVAFCANALGLPAPDAPPPARDRSEEARKG